MYKENPNNKLTCGNIITVFYKICQSGMYNVHIYNFIYYLCTVHYIPSLRKAVSYVTIRVENRVYAVKISDYYTDLRKY